MTTTTINLQQEQEQQSTCNKNKNKNKNKNDNNDNNDNNNKRKQQQSTTINNNNNNKNRLDLISNAISAVDLSRLDASSRLNDCSRKPEPPRIEILSRRILHSIDLSCKSVHFALVKDHEVEGRHTLKVREIIMEEGLADFLSVVPCFDFSLPNEEALSSAMQICIGRLVGLGLSDDEA